MFKFGGVLGLRIEDFMVVNMGHDEIGLAIFVGDSVCQLRR
jgi:hypothetical protein